MTQTDASNETSDHNILKSVKINTKLSDANVPASFFFSPALKGVRFQEKKKENYCSLENYNPERFVSHHGPGLQFYRLPRGFNDPWVDFGLVW